MTEERERLSSRAERSDFARLLAYLGQRKQVVVLRPVREH